MGYVTAGTLPPWTRGSATGVPRRSGRRNPLGGPSHGQRKDGRRDASGQPFADKATTDTTGRMIYADQHGDVIGRYLSASAPDTRSYDPFGKVTASTGTPSAAGYQGAWTDAVTGAVNMASRWYDPGSGSFRSRDTWTNYPDPSGRGNRYGYGSGNPINSTDPYGHDSSLAGKTPSASSSSKRRSASFTTLRSCTNRARSSGPAPLSASTIASSTTTPVTGGKSRPPTIPARRASTTTRTTRLALRPDPVVAVIIIPVAESGNH